PLITDDASIPKFVFKRAASSGELRNRDTALGAALLAFRARSDVRFSHTRRAATAKHAFGDRDARESQLSPYRRFLAALLRWLMAGIRLLFRILVIAWTTLAIYFSNVPWPELRLALAVVFAAFVIWAFWLSRRRRMPVVAYAAEDLSPSPRCSNNLN